MYIGPDAGVHRRSGRRVGILEEVAIVVCYPDQEQYDRREDQGEGTGE